MAKLATAPNGEVDTCYGIVGRRSTYTGGSTVGAPSVAEPLVVSKSGFADYGQPGELHGRIAPNVAKVVIYPQVGQPRAATIGNGYFISAWPPNTGTATIRAYDTNGAVIATESTRIGFTRPATVPTYPVPSIPGLTCSNGIDVNGYQVFDTDPVTGLEAVLKGSGLSINLCWGRGNSAASVADHLPALASATRPLVVDASSHPAPGQSYAAAGSISAAVTRVVVTAASGRSRPAAIHSGYFLSVWPAGTGNGVARAYDAQGHLLAQQSVVLGG